MSAKAKTTIPNGGEDQPQTEPAAQRVKQQFQERQHQTEIDLMKSEEKFSKAFMASPECIAITSVEDGRYIDVNENWLKVFGFARGEVIGHTSIELRIWVDPQERQRYIDDLTHFGRVRNFETQFRKHQGDAGDFLVSSEVINLDGKKCSINFVLDITERKKTEEALIESERFARSTLDGLSAHIAIVNDAGIIEAVNKAWKDFAIANGVGSDRVSEGCSYLDACRRSTGPEADGAVAFADAIEDVLTGRVDRFMMEYACHSPAEERWFIVRVTRFPGEGRRRVVIAHEDITSRVRAEENLRRMEERVRQSEKMDAIGQLAGGIAHDFNNVLGGIIGYTDMSLDYAPKGSLLENNLLKVLTASNRAKNLVKQILTFSRQGNPQKSVIAVRPIIKEVLDLLRASIPSSVIIETDLRKDTKPVLADPTKIHEVLLNLANNAVHAMKRKGTLSVLLYGRHLEAPVSCQTGELQPGEYTMIEVRDTGCGMDAATLSKAFDPFFTTKPVGEGTGMGLSVVLGIVQSHDGHICVQSSEGVGTTFTICLPVTDEPIASSGKDEQRAHLAGTERVLFVDDEPMLVEMALTMLTPLGYTVTGMTRSIDAFAYLREHFADTDVLVTDQTMPEVTGSELAAEALRLRKDMPVILCTGFSSEINSEKAAALGIDRLIMKPYGAHEIVKTIREVMDERKKTA